MIMNKMFEKIIEEVQKSKHIDFRLNYKDERKCWHLSCDNFYQYSP